MEKKPSACLFLLPEEWRNTWPTLIGGLDGVSVTEGAGPDQKGQPDGFRPLALSFSRGPAEVQIITCFAERFGCVLQIVTEFGKPATISISLAKDLEQVFLGLGWKVVFCTWRGVEMKAYEHPE